MKWRVAVIAIVFALLGFALGWKRPEVGMELGRRIVTLPFDEEVITGDAATVLPEAEGEWQVWVERIRSADDSETLEGLLREIEALEQKEYQFKKKLWKLLVARWVEVDPAGGLTFLEAVEIAETERSKRNPWPKIFLLIEWVRADQEAAIAGIMALDQKSRDAAILNLMSELSKTSPELCVSIIKETGFVPSYVYNEEPWIDFARSHPDVFREFALEIEAKNAADESRSRSVGRWIGILTSAMAHDDPVATLDWIKKELSPELRNPGMQGLLKAWAELDPAAAAEHLDELKDKQVGPRNYIGSGAREISAKIVKTLAKEDLQAAVLIAAKLDAILPLKEVVIAELKSGELSPQQAYDLISTTESKGETVRLNVLRMMWTGLGHGEMGESFDWLRTQPDNQSRSWAMSGMIQEWAKRDPEGLVGHLQSSTSDSERQQFLVQALSFMEAGSSEGTAEKLVNALPPSERLDSIATLLERRSRYAEQSRMSANFDVGFYADAILESPESAVRSKASQQLAESWGAIDPIAAFSWASGLPPEEAASAIGAAASTWAKHDTIGLSETLVEMPAGSGRDSATAELVGAVRDAEPDSAWQWSLRIDDPDKRLAAQRPTIAAWAELDPTAANAAIAAAEISDEAKEALRAAMVKQ